MIPLALIAAVAVGAAVIAVAAARRTRRFYAQAVRDWERARRHAERATAAYWESRAKETR